MTQLGMGVAALNHDSKFVAAYDKGAKKTEYWTYALEDSLDLIAKLPALAARIYRNTYHPRKELPEIDKDQDLVGERRLSFLPCHACSCLQGYVYRELREYARVRQQRRYEGVPPPLHRTSWGP